MLDLLVLTVSRVPHELVLTHVWFSPVCGIPSSVGVQLSCPSLPANLPSCRALCGAFLLQLCLPLGIILISLIAPPAVVPPCPSSSSSFNRVYLLQLSFSSFFFFSFLFLVETFVLKLLEKLIRRLALETGKRRRRRRSRRKRKRRRS